MTIFADLYIEYENFASYACFPLPIERYKRYFFGEPMRDKNKTLLKYKDRGTNDEFELISIILKDNPYLKDRVQKLLETRMEDIETRKKMKFKKRYY